MDRLNELKTMVDGDITYCTDNWKKISHDSDRMEKLFNELLFRYIGVVEGIADGLKVVSCYEQKSKMADTYRENTSKIVARLEAFRDNDYNNDKLMAYYIKLGVKGEAPAMSFNEVRLCIGQDETIGRREKEEILNKIDEMEQIYQKVDTKKKKWDQMRPYVMWVSGKSVDIAMKILPLFLKIN